MIGIAEHDIGAGIAHLAPVQALHGAGGADRHEGRRSHHTVRRRQPPGASLAAGCDKIKVIGKVHDPAYCVTTTSDSTSLKLIFDFPPDWQILPESRIRKDLSDPSGHSIAMFVAADQLLKGAALNAVQIAELLPQRAMACADALSAGELLR